MRRCFFRSVRPFTLIELLIVISIIGILAGIMLPVIGLVRDKAKATKTRVQVFSIATAVSAFRTEYQRLPMNDKEEILPFTNDDVKKVGDVDDLENDYQTFFEILSCFKPDGNGSVEKSTNTNNPRSKKFLDINSDYGIKGMVDAWDRPFVIMLDDDYDGLIDLEESSYNCTETEVVLTGKIKADAAVFSFGSQKDNVADKDDLDPAKMLVSWKE